MVLKILIGICAIASTLLAVITWKDAKSRDAHTDAILTYAEAIREQNALLRKLLNKFGKEV